MTNRGLYIIGTPIGNLKDMTLRALEILPELDVLYAEDTRVTGVLLARYNLKVKVRSYREAAPRHQVEKTIDEVIAAIKEGKAVGYVSDAGTPGVSDPGDYLVRRVREAGLPVELVPGVSALASILSVGGLGVQRPLFVGFLPRKKGKETLLGLLREGLTRGMYDGLVLYESPQRTVALLQNLIKWELPLRVVIGRELTKKFEELITGDLKKVLSELEKNALMGEVTVLVGLDA